ncbi:MAG: 50S ribosomal protein L18 [Candidatus Magasanikbacteria bacterium CG10_big_fil_rev_8_21_14_0_10_36_32]|uniref:Large ribosomal subunit protein uL18 n=1 Tax=Candidatus Magasanikbacteria bacterium CG10_big_fil_rev_8_21_14_0_10_36_32 TaxID=1974646 RepID=A0A2M6W6N0_9BACT|nr:MAG: 50S ribosomal protein L18 [Candidatus Magasanikbacteria bacterium CG10_big_fil_rev_8_21_14_0_10_36_32]
MRRLFKKTKNNLRQVRHHRIRMVLSGTAECPRLSVFRGLRRMILQLIDDTTGKTLCAVSTDEVKKVKVEGKSTKIAVAYTAGQLLAEKAKDKNITRAILDRGGYSYHGRVAAVAEGARDGGLKI